MHGFYFLVNKKKIVVSKYISIYFTKLVEPLVTTQRLEEILKIKSLKDFKKHLLRRIRK